MKKNGKVEKHIQKRIRKAVVAMKRTWHIGERLFKEDFERRIKMFVVRVESVALYGVEIWGWNDEGRLDTIKRRYMEWILALNKVTSNYILREEIQQEERTKVVRRVFKYEEGAKNSDKNLVRDCIREMERQRGKKNLSVERKKKRIEEETGNQ
ncbi:uncharacterized protein LOC122538397 [Frieseomelitta varia]|uniref:uncharacterized protein LOC122538397 n=1 Tax=Frieseomelitta varia TaxID=561572 RepID=UPI001CB6B55A|nr:uncharacterized protein LOC122538397 [Frieseomelitta varia]